MLKSFPKNLPMREYKAFDFTNTKLVFPSLGYLPSHPLCPMLKSQIPDFPDTKAHFRRGSRVQFPRNQGCHLDFHLTMT
jgi:hypothetical protein